MQRSRIACLVVGVALVCSAARADDPVEEVQKKLKVCEDLANLGCPAKARAALSAAEAAMNALGEFEKEKVQNDFTELKEKVENLSKDRVADQYVRQIEREINPAEGAVEQAKSYPDSEDDGFDRSAARVRDMITDEDNVKLLGAETCAKFERKLAYLKGELTKAKLGAWLKRIEDYSKKVQDVLDGKDTHSYTENVEGWFKSADELVAKCPPSEARAAKLKAELAKQRAKFDKQQEDAAKASIIEPAVKHWAYVKEEYGKDSKGWEAEKTPTPLKDWLHNSPPALGCPKTQSLLSEVVVRWFEDDRVKQAIEKFSSSDAFKPTYDDACKTREEAGNKVCAFVNKLLDEEEKLPAGADREDAQRLLDEMARIVQQDANGSTACERTIARIKALDKRWTDAKEKGEQERAALEKKLTDATNAVWPEFEKVYASKEKKIDTSEALKDIASWKGTVVHFKGGFKGGNLNRSGWNFMDQYDFIIEKDGIPVCGNFDAGLADVLKKFGATTGMEPFGCEECIGIVDGTCKVWERVKHPLDPDRYVRGRQLDGVRIRIVAWKAVVAAACVNKGTNLQKLPEYKELPVPEAGKTR